MVLLNPLWIFIRTKKDVLAIKMTIQIFIFLNRLVIANNGKKCDFQLKGVAMTLGILNFYFNTQ